jgi:hypothetical protein
MQIVLNHLTRITGERICIAGVDREANRHIRPTTAPNDLLTRELLVEEGGPLQIGAVIDIGDATPAPSPPEVEDHRTTTSALRCVSILDGDGYLSVLDRVSEPNLEGAFGPELERRKWKYAVDPHTGKASLAVIRARRRIDIEESIYGKLQVRFNDPDPPTFLTITDVRFVEPDHETFRRDVLEDVQSRIRRGVGVYLMLGLARAFTAAGDDRPRHWLQVNGICLDDRPTGEYP